MDISHRIEVCDTPAPSIVELGNYITIKSRSVTDHVSSTHRTSKSPFSTSSPTYWVTGRPNRAAPTNLRGSEARCGTSCFETSRTRMATLLRRKLLAPLSGGPIACFDSGWPELFGDFVVSRSDPRRKAGECRPWFSGPTRGAPGSSPASGTEHRIERSMDVMVAARRSMYGADMLPRTTNFGVTPEEARELNKKQQGSVLKLVCLGLPGGYMMLSPFFWAVRFYVIVGGAEHTIYSCPPSQHANSQTVFSNTTNFGVTPEEARELHEKQQAYNAANATVGKGAVTQQDGGIWDGTQTKHNNLI
ncbi:hypothetical protein LB504_008439 [Fusarium proliferatum]|nr:hypothetical protein LB504_008439 [Fusarium proliferatum]